LAELLKPLYELQEIDTQIHKVEKALGSLDDGSQLREESEAAARDLAARRQAQHDLEIEFRDEDLKLKSFETKRDQHRVRLYSGTIGNPKELEHLRNEIDSLTKSKGVIEEKLLELMERVEARKVAADAAQAESRRQDDLLAAHLADFAERSAHMNEQVVELRWQRDEAVKRVDEELLAQYARLLKRTNNLAIVRVTGSGCPGCGVEFTSFIFRRLHQGMEDLTCENCDRMLFYEE